MTFIIWKIKSAKPKSHLRTFLRELYFLIERHRWVILFRKQGVAEKNIEYITPQKSITACTYFLMSDNAKVLSGVILLVPESKNLSVEIESQI